MRKVSVRNIVLLFAFFTLPSGTEAFSETLHAVVRGDTVTIWNRNVEFFCNSLFRFDVRLSQDTLEVIEVDTTVNHTMCFCFFQLSVTLVGLPPGHYVVPVFRRYYWGYPHDTTRFVGTTEFTIGPTSASLTQWPYQSPCSQTPQAVGNPGSLPKELKLHQSYPNPFNPTATIAFDLPRRSHVVLEVYDILGQKVALPVDDVLEAGSHERSLHAANLPSGVYFYRLSANGFLQTRKMLMQK
ncbi:MAG: T9SS type A sorting domain-containing protein [Bacteroidota bacterium]